MRWKRNQNMTPTFPWNLEFCFYIFFTENQISIDETRNTLILHMPPPANIIKKGILGGRVKKKRKEKEYRWTTHLLFRKTIFPS